MWQWLKLDVRRASTEHIRLLNESWDPDFYIPLWDAIVEVKPLALAAESDVKLRSLAYQTLLFRIKSQFEQVRRTKDHSAKEQRELVGLDDRWSDTQRVRVLLFAGAPGEGFILEYIFRHINVNDLMSEHEINETLSTSRIWPDFQDAVIQSVAQREIARVAGVFCDLTFCDACLSGQLCWSQIPPTDFPRTRCQSCGALLTHDVFGKRHPLIASYIQKLKHHQFTDVERPREAKKIIAKYQSLCELCLSPVAVGDWIWWVAENRRAFHDKCWSESQK